MISTPDNVLQGHIRRSLQVLLTFNSIFKQITSGTSYF